MEFTELHLYGAIFLLIIVIFAYLFVRKRLESIQFLKLGAQCVIIAFVQIVITISVSLQGNPIYNVLLVSVAFPFIALFFFGYFFFEANISVKPPFHRLIVMNSGFIISIVVTVYAMANVLTTPNMLNLAIMTVFIYGSIAMAFGIFIFRKTLKLFRVKALFMDFVIIIVVFIGCVVVSLDFFLLVVNIYTETSDVFIMIFIIGAGMLLMGLVFLVLSSIRFGDYVYLLPIPIFSILIYDRAGILIYQGNVETDRPVFQQSEDLLSSGIVAFSSFFKEICGYNAQLKDINATTFEFLFEQLPEDSGTLVMVTAGSNYFLVNALKQFTKAVPGDLIKKIKGNEGFFELGSVDADFDKLVKEHLPFLILKKRRN